MNNFSKSTLILIYAFLLINCNSKSQMHHSISLVCNWPIVDFNGSLRYKQDSLSIIYFKDVIMYNVTLIISRHSINNDKKYDNLIFRDTIQQYNIFYKTEKKGLRYDGVEDSNPKVVLADSIERTKGLGSFRPAYKSTYTKNNDTLVSVKKNTYELIDIFLTKKLIDFTYNDSTYFYYTNQLKTPFSLSPYADSLKGMKLYRSRFIYNERTISKDTILPKRELWFEIKEEKNIDVEKIELLYEKFVVDIKKIDKKS